jgi:predicted O-methyltransferase YrrM
LPPPRPDAYPADKGASFHTAAALSVSLEDVKRNFGLYELLDDQVEFVEGWFKDSLPALRDRSWSLVRIDGDLYESTMDALVNLYPGLSIGGFLIVDDFVLPPCRAAVEDFRTTRGINEPLETIDWTAVYWRREQ